MKRSTLLTAIDLALITHKEMSDRVKSLLKDSQVKEATVEDRRGCSFSRWLYDEHDAVRNIVGAQFYDSLEQTHNKWHTEYKKIYQIFFTEEKQGLFSKLIKTNEVDPMDIDKAQLYYSELQKTTLELQNILASSERRVSAMTDTKFTPES